MKIAVTIGNPNGIGLETFIKSFQFLPETFKKENDLFLFGNLDTVLDYLNKLYFDFHVKNDKIIFENYSLNFVDTKNSCEVNFGKIEASAGKVAFEALELASNLVLEKQFDALVTLPISKTAMHLAGFNFPGHTEYLAKIDSAENPLMILFNDAMKVALTTIHEPISKISELINKDFLTEIIQKFIISLAKDFGYKNPKIAVLGLNPHAGEEGHIGTEEIDTIEKVIKLYQKNNHLIYGPFSADGFFGQSHYKHFNGILAMYHDQGLIPMKMTSVNGGVNFTAGLSFVRTSPDHGTGFDIAGKNIANPKGTLQSILWAEIIVNNRKNYKS